MGCGCCVGWVLFLKLELIWTLDSASLSAKIATFCFLLEMLFAECPVALSTLLLLDSFLLALAVQVLLFPLVPSLVSRSMLLLLLLLP